MLLHVGEIKKYYWGYPTRCIGD